MNVLAMYFIFIFNIITIFNILVAQEQDFDKKHVRDLERLKWEVVKKNIEAAVARGEINPNKAEEHFSFYRKREEIDLIPRHNKVLDNHFKNLGVEDLDIVRDDLLNEGIEEYQMEAVLGGILRLTKAIKSDSQKVNRYPRMKSYFRDRLSLNKTHVNYIMKYSKNLAGIN